MMRRLAGCILITLLITSCGDTDAELASACKIRARVEIHLPDAWRGYLAQLTAKRRAAGDDPGERFFWPTADFGLTSQWTEENRPEPPMSRVYENDFFVRQHATGALVATIRNVSLRSRGFGAVRVRLCMFDHPTLYAEAWGSPSKE